MSKLHKSDNEFQKIIQIVLKKKISVVKDQTCGIFIYCLRFCFISPDAKGRVNLFNPLTSGVIVVNFLKKLTFFLLFYRF